MSKLNEIIESIKNLRNRSSKSKTVHSNQKNTDDDEDNEKKSHEDDEQLDTEDNIDNKIDEPRTSTVNRKTLKIIALLVFAFLVAVTVGMLYSNDNKNRTGKTEIANAKNNVISKEIEGDDYDNIRLKRYDQEKMKKDGDVKNTNLQDDANTKSLKKVASTDNNVSSNDMNANNSTSYSRPVPVLNSVPNSNYTYGANPYINPVMPYQQSSQIQQQQLALQKSNTTNKTNENNSHDENSILKSAIAFITDKVSDSENEKQTNAEKVDDSSASNTSTATMSYTPPTANSIYSGTLIPMILMNGINSQTGGQIIAQVQTNIYDSLNGMNVLIPMGAKLVGQYDSGAKEGQNRVNVNWKTLIMPDGSTYNVDGVFQSADNAGYPGIPGNVNNHNGSKISAGMFSSAIAALGSIATGNNSYGNDYGWHDSGQLAMQGASANLLNTASDIFKQKLTVQPEITVDAGTSFCVYVVQSISF